VHSADRYLIRDQWSSSANQSIMHLSN